MIPRHRIPHFAEGRQDGKQAAEPPLWEMAKLHHRRHQVVVVVTGQRPAAL